MFSIWFCFLRIIVFNHWLCWRNFSISVYISSGNDFPKSQEKHVQVNSVYANSAFVMAEELETPKDENDMIHYGEIDFSTLQTKSTTEKISGEETIYAEVCGSGKN
ncbi:hypothetical protein cypCar_00026807 [Cyprinus carpio]|nr:hypothetical protein cypCar_00026807 [Cyprinus carpio]